MTHNIISSYNLKYDLWTELNNMQLIEQVKNKMELYNNNNNNNNPRFTLKPPHYSRYLNTLVIAGHNHK